MHSICNRVAWPRFPEETCGVTADSSEKSTMRGVCYADCEQRPTRGRVRETSPAHLTMNVTFEYDVDCKPRWWPEPHKQLYEILKRKRNLFQQHLQAFAACAGHFCDIPFESTTLTGPFWRNGFFGGPDAIALHGMMASVRPRLYFEIGSGNSTKFARNAIRTHELSTRLVSLDPKPRAEVDSLCDDVIREPLENVDIAIFDRLEAGDILFYDGSHQVLSNSDVTVFFLEVLPRLRSGVWVHVHDVFLPWDYPPQWTDRYYAEEYVLACWILADSPRIQIELANYFISQHPELMAELRPVYSLLPGLQDHGGSFWFQMR